MSVDLTFHYNCPDCRINSRLLQRHTSSLLRECRVADYGLSILLVDDQEISWLNDHYRHKSGPTNVLSFPFADGADSSLSMLPVKELGDIVISVDTALRESKEFKQSLHDRLIWLITHGLLHLLGYDHELSDADAILMQNKEQELLIRLQHSRSTAMTHLAINVDHIATIRQARGGVEPDPVAAAAICEMAGATGIVVHLREDRRHIQDRDVRLLRETVKTKLNLEMGANKEIIGIALDLKPDMVTLVPEKRQELTTEGGLDVASQKKMLAKTIDKMRKAGIPVSLFVDPDARQIKAAHEIGATFVEIHTGRYCDATSEKSREQEFQTIAAIAEDAYQIGLRVYAGHGLNYQTTARIAALDTIEELSIGHAIIARAAFSGLDKAVRDMLAIVKEASRIG
ncbi:MAG: pyridoxine 5'-phosphate synthase [Proteobacteria bacterium]|nr:pyridoxine 5'-phosphate synthase [Pseudomonadota bacterium]MBU1648865.1 pyridoxine 5'-phosphate synthase [Pseudomonadota bacterium]